MEINGVAHIQLSVRRFDECCAFYDELMPYLGLAPVHRSERLAYYVGGRTGFGITPVEQEHRDERHLPGRSGLHHLCFRARSREDIDDLHRFLQGLGAEM